MVARGDDPKPSVLSAENDGFLGRWSRRKAEARSADQSEERKAAAGEPEDHDESATPAGETEEPEVFDVKSLPDIDSLGATSDFSVFMQAGVPSELRTKALRKLWRLKSELANLDGLLDYGEDLTGSFKVVDHLKTAYEVGRGFLRDEPDRSAEVESEGTAEAETEEKAEAETAATDDHALSADAESAAEIPATDPLKSEPEQEQSPSPDPAADSGKALKQ